MQIVWSPQSLRDLRAIRDYIAIDSERYADLTIARIFSAVERLLDFPQSGRIVPERDDPEIREIIVGPTFVIRISLPAESSSGQLVEKEVESGDAAVAGDEEISSGVRGRRAGAARYPFDAAAIAQLLGLGNGLILKVGVSGLDRAGDPVDFVAASKGAFTRVVEHAILVPELVEGGAAARWVIFAKYVAQITKQQGRYAVRHG
jgi:plasmid stabilization system protein ParE